MRILILQTGLHTSPFTKQLLACGLMVDTASSGSRCLQLMLRTCYDCVVIKDEPADISFPRWCQEVRAAHSISFPILVTTCRSDAEVLDALSAGADCALPNISSPTVLLAYIRALTRRPPTWVHTELTLGPLTLYPERCIALIDGQHILLRPKENTILEYFLKHQNRLVTRKELTEQAWPDELDLYSNTIETHIFNIRRKLETYGPRLIHTVVGRGYIAELRDAKLKFFAQAASLISKPLSKIK